jgi:hypothetical protein
VVRGSILQQREARGSPGEAGGGSRPGGGGGGVERAHQSSTGVATCMGMFGEGSRTTETNEIGRKRRGPGK